MKKSEKIIDQIDKRILNLIIKKYFELIQNHSNLRI